MIRDASLNAAEPAPSALAAEVRHATTSALGRQSAVALYAHGALGAIALCAPLSEGARSAAAKVLGVALIALVLPRLHAAHLRSELRAREPDRWARLYGACALLSSGGLSIGATLFIALGDLGRPPWLVLLALAGVGAAGLTLFVGDAALLRFAALGAYLLPRPSTGASPILEAPPPAAPVRAAIVAETSAASVPSDRTPTGGNVLLAEDTPANQLLITSYLRKMGATITLAANGRFAVEAARAALHEGHPFDVILMDMQMPEVDGYTATRTLRSEGYSGPIVAVTAHAMAGDREKCLDAGCDEYLAKPIDRRAFASTVERFIACSRARLAIEDTIAGPLPVSPSSAPALPVGPSAAAPLPVGPSIAPPLVSELATDPDMQEILPDFLQALGERAAALRAAVLQEDSSALKRLAHQLKGVAGGYGFPSITDQARAVEEALASEDKPGVVGAVEALMKLCLRARDGGGEARAIGGVG